jgi:hypothetical protein
MMGAYESFRLRIRREARHESMSTGSWRYFVAEVARGLERHGQTGLRLGLLGDFRGGAAVVSARPSAAHGTRVLVSPKLRRIGEWSSAETETGCVQVGLLVYFQGW